MNLWAFHRTAEEKGYRGLAWTVLAGLLLAALMGTHSLSTWIFAPLLIVYIAILLFRRRDRTALGRVAVALILAAAVSAFHWLPILVESGYVGLGHSISQGYRDHLLPLASLVSFDPAYRYVFVHVTDAALTRQPAQHDGDPGGGFTSTTRWLPGELVPDTHRLALPGDLPPGRYALWAGLHEYETVRNLTVSSAGVRTADDRVYLGEIGVSER